MRGYQVIGRLKASASRRQAQEEVSMVMRQLAGAYPATNAKVTGEVLPFTDRRAGRSAC